MDELDKLRGLVDFDALQKTPASSYYAVDSMELARRIQQWWSLRREIVAVLDSTLGEYNDGSGRMHCTSCHAPVRLCAKDDRHECAAKDLHTKIRKVLG